MKILWACHRDASNPLGGGVERVVRELGSGLVERGHEVTVISGAFRGGKTREVVAGVRILRVGRFGLPHVIVPARLALGSTFDVIVDDLGHAAPWLSPWFTRTPGVAFFYHLHARTLGGQVNPVAEALLRTFERFYPSIYSSWKFVTISRSSVADLKGLGVPSDRVTLLPLGVDRRIFHPRQKAAEPQIIYFGGLRDYKRPEHAVLVLKLLVARGWPVKLVVVGTGPSLPKVRAYAQALHVADRLELVGRLEDEELGRLVGSSWLNLHCSVSEGLCLSALEAAAAGVPTVAYLNSSMAESVQNDRTGLLVEDGAVAKAVAACEQILTEPEGWSRKCSANSQTRDWGSAADAFELVLKSCCA
ncbi:MAG: glycosyltransferase family 4 protein [Thermoplasmata archaeon]|nr:glycosyltransferase family 4 protein [Thermoplasmata archaeon]